ncbi:LysR family transcriptional regulator [Halosquirtibacter laminarini]|uniref:LysR family transcriptional regulator n=1 Tax=Halosquirtibacter laminarini TaxID=3374600 RepID=A0AC61NM98_9BACT|nr:LysR family transcriptional regulator [Prolixibacteraceae bacterium]
MDFRSLVFLSVARNLNFTKAAEELHISQPAVTKHIKLLEESLETTLFQRKGNRIALTDEGFLVQKHYLEMNEIEDTLTYELQQRNDQTKGVLRIGGSSTIAQYVIPQIIAKFHQRFPNVKISLVSSNSFHILEMLNNNLIDIAFVENHSTRSDLNYKYWMDDELVIITGMKTKLGMEEITLEKIKYYPLIVREIGSGTLEVIEQIFKKHDTQMEDLNIRMHLGSTEAMKYYLREFEGIGIVSNQAIKNELKWKELKVLPCEEIKFNRTFRISTRKGESRRLIEHFIDFTLNYNF